MTDINQVTLRGVLLAVTEWVVGHQERVLHELRCASSGRPGEGRPPSQ
jgi:hypothetical protein